MIIDTAQLTPRTAAMVRALVALPDLDQWGPFMRVQFDWKQDRYALEITQRFPGQRVQGVAPPSS